VQCKNSKAPQVALSTVHPRRDVCGLPNHCSDADLFYRVPVSVREKVTLMVHEAPGTVGGQSCMTASLHRT
jgi:hypothetical protein